MAFKAPYYSKADLRQMAGEFNDKYNSDREIPVDIEFIVESDFGMDIVPVPGLQDSYDIVAFITNDQREIRVDDYVMMHRSGRFRFSLAHELAHRLLHAELWDALAFTSIGEWKSMVVDAIPDKEYGYIEFHANCFAGLVLVPPAPLESALHACIDRVRQAGLDPTDETMGVREIVEKHLGREFDVSSQVIHRRIDDDELWGQI